MRTVLSIFAGVMNALLSSPGHQASFHRVSPLGGAGSLVIIERQY